MKTFNGVIPRQKTIGFSFEGFVFYKHGKTIAEVDDISVTDIRKLGIGKPCWMFFPQGIKICFPKKINKMPKSIGWCYPVIIIFEMFVMDKFNMTHGFTFRK